MQINNTSPSFKAKFITSTPIKKLNTSNGNYEEFNASFVKYDVKNKNDLKAIKETSYWRSLYGPNIYEKAKALTMDYFNEMNDKIYILTKQKNNFEDLKVEDILGMTDVELKKNFYKESILEVHRLQVDTDLIGKEKPEFKHVGTAILNVLKKFNKIIELNSVPSAVNFYRKNGFKEFESLSLRFRWNP